MTRIGVQSLVRELAASPVPTTASLIVQAWAGSSPYKNVQSDGPVFSAYITAVIHADGRITEGSSDGPEVEIVLTPTGNLFCYRWVFKRGSDVFPARYTLLPDVESIDFGELQTVDPDSFQPTDDNLAAWLAAIATVEGIRDDTQGLRDETQTLRDQAGTSADAAGVSAGAASTSATTASTAATTATTAAGTASSAATAAGTARDGAVAARTGAETARDQAQAVAASKGQPNGIGSLGSTGRQPDGEVNANLTRAALRAAYVTVRTSDGQNLPPGTVLVISIDKTLAQVTANPVADIADITFETGA